MYERKQPPPPAPTTRSSGKMIRTHASWSTPGKDHVAPTTLDSTMATIRYEIVELMDTTIERSQATAHGLIMSQFERLSASLGQPRGHPPQPPTADTSPYSRGNGNTTHVYERDRYVVIGLLRANCNYQYFMFCFCCRCLRKWQCQWKERCEDA
jgi:hypothetical protein